jgi:hypothetical protein
VLAAAPPLTTTTSQRNATTLRAATSSCSASGESPCQTKPSPLPPQGKAKSQQHKKRALLRGATEQNLPSRPRHRNATGNKAREGFLAKSKKKLASRLASSIVFMSSPAHVSVSKQTSCRRDACWNNETLSGKKEEYFLENQGAVGSCEIVGDQYFEKSAIIEEDSKNVRDG